MLLKAVSQSGAAQCEAVSCERRPSRLCVCVCVCRPAIENNSKRSIPLAAMCAAAAFHSHDAVKGSVRHNS